MAVLPMSSSCSFKLETKNYYNMSCMARSFATATTLTAANPPTYPFHRISQRISTRPRTLGADQVLIKEADQLKRMRIEDGGCLEKEAVNVVIRRLKMVVERVRETEIQKFMSKVKGEGEGEGEEEAAEEMGREIIRKFFEKPIEYLTSDGGCLQQKLKDVGVLVTILEKSCPANQR